MQLQDDAKLEATLTGNGPAGLLPPRTVAADASDERHSAGASPVDGYQVIGRLGKGGMGTVWRAWQLSTRREVALKLLNFGAVASERAKRRFDREVELTARLSHPNIARLYDSGVHNGACYYAMELIEGLTLDAYVEQQDLPFHRILELLEIVCHAVQHAHQHGVIHRDLKPTNIIVDTENQPHVLDFGVAKVFEVNDAGSAVSIEGEVLGTPAFMSPEQAAGKGDAVDTRSDVYSLGVVLYVLLTGRTPHDTSGTYLEILRRVSENEVVRPRKASTRIDAELEAILLKALAHDAEARYSSAGLLAEDLRNYLQGEPLNARKRTALYFLRKKIWKHRIPAAAALAVAASLTGLTIYGSIQIRSQRDRAVASAAKERQANQMAQLRNAEILLFLGDNLAPTEQWEEARQRYWEARDIRADLGTSTTANDFALLDSYLHAPPPLGEVRDLGGRSYAAALGPDGRTLYSAGLGGVTTAWDTPSGRKLPPKGLPHGYVHNAAFTLDGKSAVYVISPSKESELFPSPEKSLPTSNASRYEIEIQDLLHNTPSRVFPVENNEAALTLSRDGAVAIRSTNEDDRNKPVYCYRLDGLAPPATVTLSSDWTGIRTALSRDGAKLMVAANEPQFHRGWLATWKPPEAQLFSKSEISADPVTALACTADANVVVVGGKSGSLSTWTAKGQRIRDFAGHSAEVTKAVFSPDDAMVFSGDSSGQVKLWNAANGSLLFTGHDPNAPIRSLQFSPDGQLALSTAANGSIKLWKTGDSPDLLTRFVTPPCCLALSPDGSFAAAGFGTGEVALIDTATGNALLYANLAPPLARGYTGSPAIESMAFTPDGQDLSVGHAGCIDRLHALDFTPALHFRIAPDDRDTTLLTPDARLALHFGKKGASIWDTATGRQLRLLYARRVRAATLSADGKVALISQLGELKLLDTQTGNDIATVAFDVHVEGGMDSKNRSSSCALSADGRLAMIGDVQGNVLLWDPHGTGFRALGSHPGKPVLFVGFAPDPNLAVSAGGDGTLKLWDVQNNRELRVLNRGAPGPICAAFGNGSRLIFSRPDDAVRLLDPTWPSQYRRLAEGLPRSLETLATKPEDPEANALLGEWYAFRGQWRWAVDLLERARAGGVDRSGLALARCYWKAGDSARAALGFSKLLRAADSPQHKLYLTLCLNAALQGVSERVAILATTKPAHPAGDENAK